MGKRGKQNHKYIYYIVWLCVKSFRSRIDIINQTYLLTSIIISFIQEIVLKCNNLENLELSCIETRAFA